MNSKEERKDFLRNLLLAQAVVKKRRSKARGNVIGIDLSYTSTGIAILEYPSRNLLHLFSITSKPNGLHWIRLLQIYTALRATFSKAQPLLVCYEDYAYSTKWQREAMGELGAQLKRALFDCGIPGFSIAPTSLKKFILGSGRGEKQMILKEVYKNFGIDAKTDDEADAYVAARVAYEVMSMATKRFPVIQEGMSKDERFYPKGRWKEHMPGYRHEVLMSIAANRLGEVKEYTTPYESVYTPPYH